jgi:NAD-dependent dihydropyrimidine dehydrogenase PreA subunit
MAGYSHKAYDRKIDWSHCKTAKQENDRWAVANDRFCRVMCHNDGLKIGHRQRTSKDKSLKLWALGCGGLLFKIVSIVFE